MFMLKHGTLFLKKFHDNKYNLLKEIANERFEFFQFVYLFWTERL